MEKNKGALGFYVSQKIPNTNTPLELSGVTNIFSGSSQIYGVSGIRDRVDNILLQSDNIGEKEIYKIFENYITIECNNCEDTIGKFGAKLHYKVFDVLCSGYRQETVGLDDIYFGFILGEYFGIDEDIIKSILLKHMITGKEKLFDTYNEITGMVGYEISFYDFCQGFDKKCREKKEQLRKGAVSCPMVFLEEKKVFIDKIYAFMSNIYSPSVQHFVEQNPFVEDIFASKCPIKNRYYGLNIK